ncbi:hypothetical protein PLEI_1465 [Photobacterium leiognathi lrivu.4.1]|uniref:Uncharacterized protein n=1 Tax=Photobacterium leiognathi lrivu.4.1 TaxID=1248232 RepID=A0A0U1P5E1_PHOLE|nr:hypothetical protein [Photobacterium leiognathi]GAD29812.1 hypothetical protein PLEI_1465 [Photobacterium leiognathi lrivu.4.1]
MNIIQTIYWYFHNLIFGDYVSKINKLKHENCVLNESLLYEQELVEKTKELNAQQRQENSKLSCELSDTKSLLVGEKRKVEELEDRNEQLHAVNKVSQAQIEIFKEGL